MIQTDTDTQAKVNLYDTSGQLTATLFNNQLKANQAYNVSFDTDKLNRGVYIAQLLLTNGTSVYKKMVVIK